MNLDAEEKLIYLGLTAVFLYKIRMYLDGNLPGTHQFLCYFQHVQNHLRRSHIFTAQTPSSRIGIGF